MSNPTRFGVGPSFKLTNALGYDADALVGDAVGSNTVLTDLARAGIVQVPFDVLGAPVDVNLSLGTVTDAGTDVIPWLNPSYANDDNASTAATRSAYVDTGAPRTFTLQSDLGTAQTVAAMTVYAAAAGTDPGWTDVQYSSDGLSWTSVTNFAVSWSGAPTYTSSITFDSVSARYWRLIETVPHIPFAFFGGVDVWTWSIIGAEDQTTWELGPLAHDGDDATYHLVQTAISGAIARAALDDEYRLGSAELVIGYGSAGSKTLTLYGGNNADFSDVSYLGAATYTATGSYVGQDVEIPAAGSNGFRYYRLDGSADARLYTWRLYEPYAGDAGEVASALNAHLVDTTDAHDASAVSIVDAGAYFTGTDVEAALQELGGTASGSNFVTRTRGGQSTVVTIASSGSSRTLDLGGGNVFDITLTANCTLAFSNAPASGREGSILLVLRQDGSGNRTVTWPGSVTWADAAPTLSTTGGDVDFVLLETFDGGTVWFGFPTGGGAGTASPLTTKGDIYTFTTTNARLAVGSNGRGIVADSSEPTGLRWTTQELVGEILISDTPAGTPLVFADLLQNEAQDDLIYADL